ncbi:MAG: ribonuclease P protein subunit [archaeon]
MEIHPEEFIGAELRVIEAKNKSLEGIEGKIIDETKKTFKIRTQGGKQADKTKTTKTVLKEGAVFMINNHRIIGADIAQRPDERIKLRR